jgi:hypothetical protein
MEGLLMASRKEILDEVRAGRMTQKKAAVLMGVSAPRINALLKTKKYAAPSLAAPVAMLRNPPAYTPPPVLPPPVTPAADAAALPPGPVAEPSSMADVMAPLADSGPGPAASGAAAAPPAPPGATSAALAAVDQDDVDAGREIFKLFKIKLGKWSAKMVYGIKEEDPRLRGFDEDNAFLRIAAKRNQEKAAPIGKLTKGYKGLVIGLIIEVARVVIKFGVAEWTAAVEAAKNAPPPVADVVAGVAVSAVSAGTPEGLKRSVPATRAPELEDVPRRSLAEKVAAYAAEHGIKT